MNDFLSAFNNHKPYVFPKGKFDHIFLFISDYLYRMHEFGLAIDIKGGIGEIPVPKTIAMKLFYDYFHAVKEACDDSVLRFMTDQAFCFLTCGEEKRTKQELAELALMKNLLYYCRAYTWDDMLEGVSYINCLASFLCSAEGRRDVTTNLNKVETCIQKLKCIQKQD
ncbi:MAG: hypothetical protein FWE74_07210 [Oscillospiraceae bacterium]|nr:hypothetical protein [Oscillospiraceae bacterium]